MLVSSANSVEYVGTPDAVAAVDPSLFQVAESVPVWKDPLGPARSQADPNVEPATGGDGSSEISPEAALLIPDWVAEPMRVPGSNVEEQLVTALGRLRHATATVERRLGEGLRLFRDGRFDPLVVGPCDYVGLARTELGLSPTRAREAVRLVVALERFPKLEAAFEAGAVTKSHVLAILSVIDSESEGKWVSLASRLPVEKLKATVREFRAASRGSSGADDSEATTTVEIFASPDDLHTVRVQGKEMVERLLGGPVSEAAALEAICADWAAGHMDRMPEIQETPRPTLDIEGLLALGGEILDEDSNATREADPIAEEADVQLPFCKIPTDSMFEMLPDPRRARNPHEALAALRRLMALGQSLAWQTGRALTACRTRDLDIDVEALLGIGVRKAAYLRNVDKELRWRPTVGRAYATGRIGWTKTQEILRICTDRTAEAWIQWAESTTLRLLQRSIEAELGVRELNAAHWRKSTGGMPPTERRLRALGIVPGCAWADWDRICAAANIRCEEGMEDGHRKPHALLRPRVAWRIRLPIDAAALVHAAMLAAMRKYRTTDEGACLRRMTEEFLEAGEAEHRALGGRHPVQERDGYLCQFPDCSSRALEADHIRLKSAQGPDDLWNRISLCWIHHHAGKHLGRFAVYGRAATAADSGSATRLAHASQATRFEPAASLPGITHDPGDAASPDSLKSGVGPATQLEQASTAPPLESADSLPGITHDPGDAASPPRTALDPGDAALPDSLKSGVGHRDSGSSDNLYFIVGPSGGPQRVWKNDRLLGTLPGVEGPWDLSEIRSEADLHAWLVGRAERVH